MLVGPARVSTRDRHQKPCSDGGGKRMTERPLPALPRTGETVQGDQFPVKLSDMAMFPENPFRPGFGEAPAHLGRRPDTERRLLRILESLRSGRAASQGAFIYSSPGNGKTVLLNWFETQAAGGDGGAPVQQVRFSARDLAAPELMLVATRQARSQWAAVIARLRIAVKTDLPLVSLEFGTRGADSAAAALTDWLGKSDAPLLLTIDDAHEADPAALGDLLNEEQIAGGYRPIALVLAGTPGLPTTLNASGAGFWSRGAILPLGVLSDEAAHAVLARPFRDAGLEAEDGAVTALARAADNYPFFLQLCGRAAWDILAATGERVLGERHVQPAFEATAQDRRLYYASRYEEFERRGLLPLAQDVARACRITGGQLKNIDLDIVLARHDGDRIEMRAFLKATGFIWQADGWSVWTPGIPGLMDRAYPRLIRAAAATPLAHL